LAELIKLGVHGGGDNENNVVDDDGAGGGDEGDGNDEIGGGGGGDALLSKASCALGALALDGDQPRRLELDDPVRLGVARASGYTHAAEPSTARQSEASALSGLSGLGAGGDNTVLSAHRPPKDLATRLPQEISLAAAVLYPGLYATARAVHQGLRAVARRAMQCWPALARLGGRIRVRARSPALPRERAHARRWGRQGAGAAVAARPTRPPGAQARPRDSNKYMINLSYNGGGFARALS